jgi:hypothetical protein
VLELCERWRPDMSWRRSLPGAPRFVRWSFYSSATAILVVGVLLLLASGGGARNPFLYAVF